MIRLLTRMAAKLLAKRGNAVRHERVLEVARLMREQCGLAPDPRLG